MRIRAAATGWAALALVLAGCGGDDREDRPAEPSPSATSSTTAGDTATQAPDTDAAESTPAPLPTAEPADLGFDPQALERIARDAEQKASTCLLVMRDGQVVLERYWNDGAADKPQEVFSVTKSVTSTLVGIAQADGGLALSDRAATYIPEWRGTPSRTVTVRNLLANDSGRFWSAESDYGSLIQAPDRSAYAVGLEQVDPPGTVWHYNNAAIQTLDRVIRAATGEVTADFAQERLFGPLGMASTRMTPDASGKSTQAFFGMQSTCPDLARFGRLFEQQGEWDGEQLLPRSWVRDAVGRSSQPLNAGYGLLWWVNRSGPQLEPVQEDPTPYRVGRLVPGAPADMYAALGFGGQVVMVDPGSGTVVVRLGTLGTGQATPTSGAYSLADAARVVTEALVD